MAAPTQEKNAGSKTPDYIKAVNAMVQKRMQPAQTLLMQAKQQGGKAAKKK